MAAYSAHSGVEELVQLKQLVDVAAIEFDTASSAVVVARKELEECARTVETTSQQQLALLQRREYGWTAQEGTDFATCVAEDIRLRKQLDQCRQLVTTAEHAVTSAEDGSEAFAPPGDNATVIATSESLTRAASRPESDIERISHRPEHAHAAPFTSRDAVTELTLVSLRSEPTSNDPHDRSVSATESPPCFRTWSGMSTRRFPSQSRSQSSAERACATAPHARAHHTTATRTTRTDAGTPIFAAGLRARRAVCVSARLEKSESGASWQVEKPSAPPAMPA